MRHDGGLAPQFLRPALAEIVHTQAGSSAATSTDDGLGDGDQRDLARDRPARRQAAVKSIFHGGEAFGQHVRS